MTPQDVLRQYWNYPDFRPGQADIIDSVLAGRDTLALLPTGGGKSICFQVPGLLREGVTLVVSPLIALMKDQVRQLRERGILADALYSGLRRSDIDRLLDNAVYGRTKFLYLSPERLVTELARARIARMQVAAIAVDEAHCISQWGYDFRPPYLRIAEIRELHPDAPVIAVTATATPRVVEDIQDKLAFGADRRVFRHSFARPNLRYVVRRPEGKDAQLLSVLNGVPGTSIVYVRSRGLSRQIAHQLRRRGIAAASYHAGLDGEERDRRQAAWTSGELRVVVATNAFGMGIDKADVRSVIHYTPPDSPEAYFQEAGRGGRDGRPAYAILLYHERDGQTLHQQWATSYPPLAEVRRTYNALGNYLQLAVGGGRGEAYDFDLAAFAGRFGFDVRSAHSALKVLERAGYLVLTEAIHQPATLQFTVGKEQLYDYQLKHPGRVKLIKSILRTSQGAFVQPVQLREGSLANFLGLSLEELRRNLGQMRAAGVVDYAPEKDSPQLVFTEERIDPTNLRIDERQYNFLRDGARQRLEVMIRYATTDDRCRAHDLLAYFGETPPADCGHCDVCLGRRRRATNPPLVPRLVLDRINGHLDEATEDDNGLLLREAAASYGSGRHAEVHDIIQHLVNEGLLRRDGDYLRRP